MPAARPSPGWREGLDGEAVGICRKPRFLFCCAETRCLCRWLLLAWMSAVRSSAPDKCGVLEGEIRAESEKRKENRGSPKKEGNCRGPLLGPRPKERTGEVGRENKGHLRKGL